MGSEMCIRDSVSAAVAAGSSVGGYDDFKTAQANMTSVKQLSFTPDPARHATYNELFELYRQIHDAFGGINRAADLRGTMKKLLKIKERQRSLGTD